MSGDGPAAGVPVPFARWTGAVRPEWLDYNGHLADWAYSAVCAEANEELLDFLGVSAAYRERTGCTTYTVESHLRFLAEVGPDASLRAESLLTDADAKRLTVRTEVFVVGGAHVLTADYVFLHVDQRLGKVVPFPPDRAEAVRATLAAHASR